MGTLDESRGKGSGYRWVIEWAVILMAVLLCTVLLRTYVIQSFYIPSPSMVPTLAVGDRIMVNKLSYDLHAVHRGDIVVFKRPPLEEQDFPDLVKRVVGLPGETISTRNGHVYINGKLLRRAVAPARARRATPGRCPTTSTRSTTCPARSTSRRGSTSSWGTTAPTPRTAGTSARSPSR